MDCCVPIMISYQRLDERYDSGTDSPNSTCDISLVNKAEPVMNRLKRKYGREQNNAWLKRVQLFAVVAVVPVVIFHIVSSF